ncbi:MULTISPECIES: hypothetical protein [unclassified Roseovarius]|uniref:hypothetical protein n=1 Tax=unclassified Roseovarius TaxID=2614913 RepID=UPI00273EFD10|nr:hypothetical protein [Roseovarius sp. MMSF_3350]
MRDVPDRTTRALARGIATGVVVTLAASGLRAQEDAPGELLANHGCVVGPKDVMAADGVPQNRLDELSAYAEAALDAGEAERQGDWIVLEAEICTILPPEIESSYDIESSLVQRHVSAVDANAEVGEHGCFIASEGIQNDLVALEGLSPDAAAVAYLEMIAQGVRSGRVTFFSDDPLRTPSGFQALTGACAEVPQIEAIRRSQTLMLEHFDTIVRENAKRVTCAANANPVTIEVAQVLSDATDGESVNQWTMMEVLLLSIGAGWIEGVTATQRGTPRPPICSHVE